MITEIKNISKKLPKKEKEIFNRIFRVYVGEGFLKYPESMEKWIKERWKPEDVKKQKIVRIENKITGESSLFNELRSNRPVKNYDKIEKVKPSKDCPFCNAEKLTPEDTFGRVRGKYCVTASNVAKYDCIHGIIIFNEHNPYSFERERVSDYLDVAMKWFRKAHEENERATYPYIMWNCMWRAGASLDHGHLQVLLNSKKYEKARKLESAGEKYKKKYGNAYWDDLYKVSKKLGIGLELKDVRVFESLTPFRDKETVIYGKSLNKNFKDVVSLVLKSFYKIGVRSFNMFFYLPPLNEKGYVIAKLVDRGNLAHKNSDVGAMEIFATPVINDDPFKVAKKLKKLFFGF